MSKRIFILCIYFILLGFLNISFENKLISQDKKINNYYSGTIADKFNIGMDLNIENSNVTGGYFYLSQGKTINLSGTINGKKEFTLIEKVSGLETGKFQGSFDISYESGKGEWLSKDGKKKLSFSLNKIAEYILLKSKKFEVSVTYPKFFLKNQTNQNLLNEKLGKILSSELDSGEVYIKDATEDDKELIKESYYEVNTRIIYVSDFLVSLFTITTYYTGGAHPGYNYSALNYSFKDGAFKEIKITDLFLKNSNCSKVLSDFCLADLKKQEASSVVGEEITDLSGDIEKGGIPFTILTNGLRLYFSPYVVASYAEGAFEVYVPYSKLKNILNFDGVLGEFKKYIK